MEFLASLWLPIVLAAVFVFVVSSVLHMALPIHKHDMRRLADEAAVIASLRSARVAPGEYMFPSCDSMKDMGTPELQEKLKSGPVGFLSIFPPGGYNMGKSLVQWFLYTVVVGGFVAYLADLGLKHGAPGGEVFRFTSAAAFLVYGLYPYPHSIWKCASWMTSLKFTFDGLLYALTTGATFAWLWPAVA